MEPTQKSSTTASSPSSSAREAAVEHREQIQRALVALEGALAAAAPGNIATWSETVATRLAELQTEFANHVRITEGTDGLYDDIVSIAPGNVHAIDGLRREHREIEETVAVARAELAAGPPAGDAADWVAARREECTGILGRVVRHRQRGADLTWRAYHEQLGSG
jgi:hypothetical protein